MKNKRLTILLCGALSLLLIPAFAMQFTKQVNWSSFDFLLMGFLLSVTALLIEFGLRKVSTLKNRLLLIGLILFGFFLIWAELAVGLFGSPFAGS